MKKTCFLGAFAISFVSSNAFAGLLKFSAEYSLPVPIESEIPESSRKFQVDYYVVQDVPDQETAVFVLPQELTGKRVSISMQVTSVLKEEGVVTRTLEGATGKANCIGAWKAIKCTYVLPGLKINEKDVEEFLSQKYGEDSDRILELQSISKEFDADPIGVISVQ